MSAADDNRAQAAARSLPPLTDAEVARVAALLRLPAVRERSAS